MPDIHIHTYTHHSTHTELTNADTQEHRQTPPPTQTRSYQASYVHTHKLVKVNMQIT